MLKYGLFRQSQRLAAVLLDAEKYQEIQDQLEFMRKITIGLDEYKNKKRNATLYRHNQKLYCRSQND